MKKIDRESYFNLFVYEYHYHFIYFFYAIANFSRKACKRKKKKITLEIRILFSLLRNLACSMDRKLYFSVPLFKWNTEYNFFVHPF